MNDTSTELLNLIAFCCYIETAAVEILMEIGLCTQQSEFNGQAGLRITTLTHNFDYTVETKNES